MLQHSKILQSRDSWKRKAVERAERLREQRKAHTRARQRIERLQAAVKALEQQVVEKKVRLRPR